jgi:exopolysaccharide biosynthesis polyprenyl glycosylphosphotransferase
MLMDIVGLAGGLALAHWLRFNESILTTEVQYPYMWLLPLFLFANYVFELYDPSPWRERMISASRWFIANTLTVLVLFALIYISSDGGTLQGRGVLAMTLGFYTLVSLSTRFWLGKRLRKSGSRSRWLFIGDDELAGELTRDFGDSRAGQIAFLSWKDPALNPTAFSGRLNEGWTGVIVAGTMEPEYSHILMNYRLSGRVVFSIQQFYENFFRKQSLGGLDASWLAFGAGFDVIHNRLNLVLKRSFDILISLTLIILTLPVQVLLMILIPLESRGSALFFQNRVGLNGEVFRLAKFRSMVTNAEKDGPQWAATKDARVTRIGKWIRLLRFDELPQLYNILKGEMSFVGPRPERPEFTELLAKQIPFYDLRHIVKPGLTGWAQILHGYAASQDDAREKLKYDLYYIKNQTFLLDLMIVGKTISVVVMGRGR